MRRFLVFAVLALAPLASGQELKIGAFDRLKAKASDSTNINLNKNLLGFGASLLGGDKGDGDKLKKLVAKLDSIQIHTLEFDKEGVFSEADTKSIISEMGGPGWNLVVSADEQKGHEISRIWIKTGNDGEIGGLRIVSAEPKELSVIEIVGKVRLEDLQDLRGLGIPNITSEHTGQAGKK